MRLKIEETGRGFYIVEHPDYVTGEAKRLVQESSAIGDYADAYLRGIEKCIDEIIDIYLKNIK